MDSRYSLSSYRLMGVVGSGIAGSLVLLLVSLMLGEKILGPVEAVFALFGQGSELAQLIVWELRLPRALAALAVGVALASAGALLQGITSNPVASPSLLGINAGAALALVSTAVLLDDPGSGVQQIAAFAGAAFAAMLAFSLAGNAAERLAPARLAIAGAAVALFLSAMTTAVLLANQSALEEIRFWLAGAVWRAGWQELLVALPVIGGGLLAAIILAPSISVLGLGEDSAGALGLRAGRARLVAGIAALAMAGGAVTVAGPVGFVGLIVPHWTRTLVGGDYVRIIPASALLGGMLTLAADTLGRLVFAPAEVPVSAMTALIGAPYFLLLVRRLTVAQA